VTKVPPEAYGPESVCCLGTEYGDDDDSVLRVRPHCSTHPRLLLMPKPYMSYRGSGHLSKTQKPSTRKRFCSNLSVSLSAFTYLRLTLGRAVQGRVNGKTLPSFVAFGRKVGLGPSFSALPLHETRNRVHFFVQSAPPPPGSRGDLSVTSSTSPVNFKHLLLQSARRGLVCATETLEPFRGCFATRSPPTVPVGYQNFHLQNSHQLCPSSDRGPAPTSTTMADKLTR
jgi:hypothetical protein